MREALKSAALDFCLLFGLHKFLISSVILAFTSRIRLFSLYYAEVGAGELVGSDWVSSLE